MNILILSGRHDLHAQAVAWALNQQHIAATVLDVTDFPSNRRLTLWPGAGSDKPLHSAADMASDEILELADVSAVWCRRLCLERQHLDYDKVHPSDLDNVATNSSIFVSGMWYFIKEAVRQDANWINPLEAVASGNSKARQLRVASSVGFTIPETIMSNDAQQIRDFFSDGDHEMIMKPFAPVGWKENSSVYLLPTTIITKEDLADDASVQVYPAIFQRLVKKKYELRVTIFGDHIISVKLNSQAHAHTAVDWRLDLEKPMMQIEPHELDEASKSKILRLMRKMGLKTGSMDFIVDEHDNLVFLEVNEQGQFLFLETHCPEIPMLAFACQYFAEEAGFTGQFSWPSLNDFLQSDSHNRIQAQKKVKDAGRRLCPNVGLAFHPN